MTPFEAFKMYLAVRNHFNTKSYDYFKYNGKINAKIESYETHKNKYMFYKLSKKDDPLNYLVANLIDNPKIWIGEIFDKEGEQRYTQHVKRIQSLTYLFKEEIENMLDDFDQNFAIPEFDNPHLLKLFYRKKISKESMIIIDRCVGYLKVWNKKISDKIIWPNTFNQLTKYSSFINIENDKYCGILRNRFT